WWPARPPAAGPRSRGRGEGGGGGESLPEIKATPPEFLPFRPPFPPTERGFPQSEPMPPPRAASHTFSFQRPTMPSSESLASFRKQEIGRPREVPPFDRTGVAGMNQRLLM